MNWPCVLNVLLLAMAGGVMAVRDERLIQQGKLVRKVKTRVKEPVEQITGFEELPGCATDYIKLVAKAIRYRSMVRQEVAQELIDHFTDGLRDCRDEAERQEAAERLIAGFGETAVLAKLIRRGKKRCRPLWQQGLMRSLQGVGIILAVLGLYTWWFVSGAPMIRVDYLEVLNKMHSEGVTQDNNAWGHYVRAGELYVEPVGEMEVLVEKLRFFYGGELDVEGMTDGDREMVAEWIEQNEPAWQELVAGSNKGFCFGAIEYHKSNKEKWLTEVAYGEVQMKLIRFFKHLMQWRIWQHIREGRIHQAVEDCFVMLHVGKNLHNNGMIIEHMIAVLLNKLTHNGLLRILATNQFSSSELKGYQARLEQIYPEGYPYFDIEWIRVSFLDFVQHVFTEGGPGGGHVIPGQLAVHFDKLRPPSPIPTAATPKQL